MFNRTRVLIVCVLCGLCLALLPSTAHAQEQRTVTIPDANLYSSIVTDLQSKGITCTTDDATNTIVLDVSAVTTLDVSNSYVKKLSGLEQFTALTSLDVANNPCSDLSPLASLTGLRTLRASGCAVSDIAPILSLSGLERLELAGTRLISDAAGEASYTARLSALPNLTWLDLSHNLIVYTTGLSGLSHLEHLDLYDNAVSDLSGIRGMSSLTYLNLGQNNERDSHAIEGLDALDGLVNLTFLDFSYNFAPEVASHLADLTKLTYLQLQANHITDISGLAGLTKLETLILARNEDKRASDDKTIRIQSLEPLQNMAELRELNLNNALSFNNTNVASVTSILKADSSTTSGYAFAFWPELQKIDVANCWTNFEGTTDKLLAMDRASQVQAFVDWNSLKASGKGAYAGTSFSPAFDPASLVKTDGDVTYVSYDDFGARCDGSYDDYLALRYAHSFANYWLVRKLEQDPSFDYSKFEVRASEDRAYHVFGLYDPGWQDVLTNVDWHGATIVLHNEEIENKYARALRPFICRTLDGGVAYGKKVTLTGLSVTVGTSLKAGDKLPDQIVSALPTGYERYQVELFDEDHKQHIRSGASNANAGEARCDTVVCDASGVSEHDVQWDFDKLTKVVILPIPTKAGYLRNANIVDTGIPSKSETPYHRGSKDIYSYRCFYCGYTANVTISGITHRLGAPDDWRKPWDEVSGSPNGLFWLANSPDLTVRDCTLYGHKYIADGRSTYDLPWAYCTNLLIKNVNDHNPPDDESNQHRWSTISGHGGKNVTFENCKTNAIGTHQTVYNLTVRDCETRNMPLCGQGLLDMRNVTVRAEFMGNLRSDYGTTWNGEVRMVGCKHIYNAANRPRLLSLGFDTTGTGAAQKQAYYGYDTRYPNLYVQDLTIDYTNNNRVSTYWNGMNGPYYVIHNTPSLTNPPTGGYDFLPQEYWPANVVVNGAQFVNAQAQVERGSDPVLRLTAVSSGSITTGERNYLMCNLHVMAGGKDVTAALFAGECPELKGPVTVSADVASGAAWNLRVVQLAEKGEAATGASLAADLGATSPATDGRQEGASALAARLSELPVAEQPETSITWKDLSPVAEAWNGSYADPGTYELRLASTSDKDGWEGARTVRFSIANEGQTPHVHAWAEDYTTDVEPTCEEAGSKSRHCTVAGCEARIDVRAIPAIGHEWGAWEQTKAPSYVVAGERQRVCARDASHVEKEAVKPFGPAEAELADALARKDARGAYGYGEGIGVRPLYTRPYKLYHSSDPAEEKERQPYQTVAITLKAAVYRGNDLAVRYVGDAPTLVVVKEGWNGWTTVSPTKTVSLGDGSGQEVALYSWEAIEERWYTTGLTGSWKKAQLEEGGGLPAFDRMCLSIGSDTSKVCQLVEVVALSKGSRATPAMRGEDEAMTAQKIVDDLYAGYNLSGHFESHWQNRDADGNPLYPKDGGWSQADIDSESHWKRGAFVTRQTLADLHERGFRTIRIPVTWYQHLYAMSDDGVTVNESWREDHADLYQQEGVTSYPIDRAWLYRVHEVVDWCYEQGFYVILNTHHEAWLERADMGDAYEQIAPVLRSVWEQLAAEFDGYDQRLIFEGMNEPHAIGGSGFGEPTLAEMEVVNKLSQDFVDVIRTAGAERPESRHSQRLVMVVPYCGASYEMVRQNFRVPADGMLAISTHCYSPHAFTHFGDKETLEETMAHWDDNVYTERYRDDQDDSFEDRRLLYTDKGYPTIMGEFGAYYSGENVEPGRILWIENHATHMKELGIPGIIWGMDRADKDNKLVFNLYDENANAWEQKSKAYLDKWFEVLEDDSVAYGSRRTVSADEHMALADGIGLLREPTSLPQDTTNKNEQYRVALSPRDAQGNDVWVRTAPAGTIKQALEEGSEIAVKFTGDVPQLWLATIKDGKWLGWSRVDPRQVLDHEGYRVAYYPSSVIRHVWEATSDGAGGTFSMDDLMFVYATIPTDGKDNPAVDVLEARLLSAEAHDWGEWERTIEPSYLGEGLEMRTCKKDPSHTDVRAVPATGPADDALPVALVGEGSYGAGIQARPLYTRPLELRYESDSDKSLDLTHSPGIDLRNPEVVGADIAVRFTGEAPYLVLVNHGAPNKLSNWYGWTTLNASKVVEVADGSGQKVAIFSRPDLDRAWYGDGAWEKEGTWKYEQLKATGEKPPYHALRVDMSKGTGHVCQLVEVVALVGAPREQPTMRVASQDKSARQIADALHAGYNFSGHFMSTYTTGTARDGGWGWADVDHELNGSHGSYLTREDLRQVHARGFDAIRLPVTWCLHSYAVGTPGEQGYDPYHIDRAWLWRIHEVVDWCLDEGLYVIINMHNEDWLYRALEEDPDTSEMPQRFRAYWAQIAAEFDGYDQRLIFEGMNEPHIIRTVDGQEKSDYNTPTPEAIRMIGYLNQEFVNLVRARGASVAGSRHDRRLLMVPGFAAGIKMEILDALEVPADPSELVAISIHNYQPGDFTSGPKNALAGTEETDGSLELVYTETRRETLDRAFETIRARLTDRLDLDKVPVIMGEFGCSYHGEARQPDRLTWMYEFMTYTKRLGIPAFIWPFSRAIGSAGGLLDPGFYNEYEDTWSDKGKPILTEWMRILADDDIAWGDWAKLDPSEHLDLSEGESLVKKGLATPFELVGGTETASQRLFRYDASGTSLWGNEVQGAVWPAIEGKEIAVRFTGDVPYLYVGNGEVPFADGKMWVHVRIDPRVVVGDQTSEEGAIAYFPSVSLRRILGDYRREMTIDGETQQVAAFESDLSNLCVMNVRTAGTTSVHDVRLLARHEHVWGEWEVVEAATCTEAGRMRRVCKTNPDHVQAMPIAALGHDWAAPVYTWADDLASVTATRSCRRAGCGESESETGTVSVTVVKAATCTEAGSEVLSVSFQSDAFAAQSKERETVALCHDWAAPVYTWADDLASVTATRSCRRAGCSESESETVTVTRVTEREATTAAKGMDKLSASFQNPVFAAQQRSVETPMRTELSLLVDSVVQGTAVEPRAIWSRPGEPQVTLAYKPQGAADDAYGTNAPTAPGTYVVRATAPATNDYAAGEATATFSIYEAVADVAATGYEGTYDGAAHGIAVDAPGASGVSYQAEGGDAWEAASPAFVDAGSYVVRYKVARAGGGEVVGSQKVVIRKAPLVVRANDVALSYGDEPRHAGVSFEGFVAGEGADEQLTGALSYGFKGYAAGDAVGTYKDVIVLDGSTLAARNYDVSYRAGTITVAPKAVGIVWQDTRSMPYTGAEQGIAATVEGARPGDDVSCSYQHHRATDAGTYVAGVTGLAGARAGNYVLASDAELTCEWHITKAANAAKVTLEGWTYGAQAPKPQVEATFGADGATFAYAAEAKGPYSDVPPTNAGTYYVRARIEGTANYEGATSVPAKFAVAKAVPNVGKVTAPNATKSTDAASVQLERGDKTLAGTLALTDPALRCGTRDYTWRFVPEASLRANYEEATGTVAVTVEHAWGAPSYVWADDYASVTATRVCANDTQRDHVETETVTTTSRDTAAATPDAPGTREYTATFANPAFDVQTKKVEIPRLPSSAGAVRATEHADNWGGGMLVSDDAALAKAVPLTDFERSRLQAGDDVRVWVEVSELEQGESEADLATAEGAKGEHTIACLLDVSLFKQVGDAAPVELHELDGPVEVALVLPEALQPPEGVTRTYVVIRVHEGEAKVLSTRYDAATATLTFRPDAFSSYAVAYRDEVANPSPTSDADARLPGRTTPAAKPTATKPATRSATRSASAATTPRTADLTPCVGPLVLLGLVALVGAGTTGWCRHRR